MGAADFNVIFSDMRRVNYRSDFDFMMVLRDCRGEEAGFPDYDWEALLYTRGNKANGYRAWYREGVCGNCFDDGGRVHVVVDGHRLGQGELFVDFRASLPDGIYPDGSRDEVSPQPTGIELVAGKGDCGTTAEVELMLPYIKGDAFTYEDFTPEQIADLKRPATEAAGRLDEFVRTASEAEAVRADNEKSRVSAEAARERREELRVSAEETRIADETKRGEAEAERAEAEEGRRTAERERAAEFATWETEIDGKADRGTVFDVVATEQVEEEGMPVGCQQFVCNSVSAHLIVRGDILRISFPDGRRWEVTVSEIYYNRGIGRFSGLTTTPDEPVLVILDTAHSSCSVLIMDIALTAYLSAVTGVPAEGTIGDIEPTLVTEALRKVPQALTPEEQAQVKTNLGISKMELFDDMWRAAVGIWGDIDHGHYEDGVNKPYYLNELWLTYEEAVAVYEAYHKGVDQDEALAKLAVRTNIPVRAQWGSSLTRYAQGNTTVEALNLPMNLMLDNNQQAFYGCTNLRSVYGLYHLNGRIDQHAFYNCRSLEYVAINKLKGDLRLDWSPLLSLESLEYLVDNAANTGSITITVHAEVYAKLTDETNTEWNKVLTDAAARNITFATT